MISKRTLSDGSDPFFFFKPWRHFLFAFGCLFKQGLTDTTYDVFPNFGFSGSCRWSTRRFEGARMFSCLRLEAEALRVATEIPRLLFPCSSPLLSSEHLTTHSIEDGRVLTFVVRDAFENARARPNRGSRGLSLSSNHNNQILLIATRILKSSKTKPEQSHSPSNKVRTREKSKQKSIHLKPHQ